jgi:hypothetical protein
VRVRQVVRCVRIYVIDRRTRVFGAAKTNMKIYLNELEVLKRLKYRYIVNLVGSYTDLTYLGLIMSPEATPASELVLAFSTDQTYGLEVPEFSRGRQAVC